MRCPRGVVKPPRDTRIKGGKPIISRHPVPFRGRRFVKLVVSRPLVVDDLQKACRAPSKREAFEAKQAAHIAVLQVHEA